nr:immunoglobulin heavy chain junction region [Mus musculus]
CARGGGYAMDCW